MPGQGFEMTMVPASRPALSRMRVPTAGTSRSPRIPTPEATERHHRRIGRFKVLDKVTERWIDEIAKLLAAPGVSLSIQPPTPAKTNRVSSVVFAPKR